MATRGACLWTTSDDSKQCLSFVFLLDNKLESRTRNRYATPCCLDRAIFMSDEMFHSISLAMLQRDVTYSLVTGDFAMSVHYQHVGISNAN